MDPNLIISLVLPLLGIMIVVFCVLSFFFPYGERFKDKIQRIKGFGLDLEVSVLTLFIIVGVVLSLTGIYLQVKRYEEQVKRYEEQVLSAKEEARVVREALAKAQKMRMKPLVVLEGIDARDMPKLADVKCEYFLFANEKPVAVPVENGINGNQFRLTLEDVTYDTVIRSLILKDRSTKKKWFYENFSPFEPLYTLKKQE